VPVKTNRRRISVRLVIPLLLYTYGSLPGKPFVLIVLQMPGGYGGARDGTPDRDPSEHSNARSMDGRVRPCFDLNDRAIIAGHGGLESQERGDIVFRSSMLKIQFGFALSLPWPCSRPGQRSARMRSVIRARQRHRSRRFPNHQFRVHLVTHDVPLPLFQ
jgi:hypothetical protein